MAETHLVLAHPGLNWPIPASAAQEVGVAQPFLHVKVPWAQAVGACIQQSNQQQSKEEAACTSGQ
eukprot:scaffold90255_cov14-Tisochrysis_lutea.AAC.1